MKIPLLEQYRCNLGLLWVVSALLIAGSGARGAGVTHTAGTTATKFSSNTGWTNNAPNAGSAGDIATFVSTAANLTTLLDVPVTIGQIVKGGNRTWTITSDGTDVFTLDNTVSGSLANPFGGTLAFIGGNAATGALSVAPAIVIGNSGGIANPGLSIGVTGSGTVGTVTLTGGITGTGNVYVAGGSGVTAGTISITTAAINNTGTLTLGMSDANTTQSGTNSITVSGGVGSNVGNIVNVAAGLVTLSINAVNNSGTITNNSTKASGVGVTVSAAVGSGVTAITENAATSTMTVSGAITLGAGNLTLTNTTPLNNGLAVTGGITGTGNLILNNNATGTVSGAYGLYIQTALVNNAGTITNSGTGSATTLGIARISGGIGTNVTGIFQSSDTSELLISGTGGSTFALGQDMTLTSTSNGGGTAGLLQIDAAVTGNHALTLGANGSGAITLTAANNGGTITNAGTGSGVATLAGTGANVTGIIQNSASSPLVLNDNTNFGGPVTLSAGILRINTNNSLGGGGGTPGTFTIGAGTTLENTSSSTVQVATANPININGSFSFGSNSTANLYLGTGTVTLGADTTITSNAATNTLVVSGTASAIGTGAGILGAHNLAVSIASGGSVQFNNIINNGGTFSTSSTDYSANSAATGRLVINAGIGSNVGNVTFNTLGTTTFSANANNGGGVNNNGTITNNGAGSISLAAVDTGPNVTAITTNAAAITLGTLEVNAAGTTLTATSTATGAISGAFGVGGTGDLTLVNNSAVGNGVSFTSVSLNNAGDLTFSGTGSSRASYGAGSAVKNILVNSGGNVSIGTTGSNASAITNSGNITLSATGAATVALGAGTGTGSNNGLINNTGFILNNGTTTGSTTISGNLGTNVTSLVENSSSSTLIISGINDVAGGFATGTAPVTIRSGTLQVGGTSAPDPDALGSGNTVAISANGIFNVNGSSLTIAGLNDDTTGGGTVANGGLSAVLTLGGSGTYSFSGSISPAVPARLSLLKTGPGTQTLAGASTYTGATGIRAGTLLVSGSLATASAVTIGDAANLTTAAVLAGGGSVGAVTLGAASGNTGARVRPGNGQGTSTGTTLNTGNFAVTAGSGAHVDLQVGRATPGASAAGDRSDHLNVAGTVTVAGDLTLSSLTSTGYTTGTNDVLYLILNDGTDAVAGIFDSINGNTNGGAGYAQGSTFTLGSDTYEITYQANYDLGSFTGGNDVAIMDDSGSAVPESNSWAAVCGVAGLVLCGHHLRRRTSLRLLALGCASGADSICRLPSAGGRTVRT